MRGQVQEYQVSQAQLAAPESKYVLRKPQYPNVGIQEPSRELPMGRAGTTRHDSTENETHVHESTPIQAKDWTDK